LPWVIQKQKAVVRIAGRVVVVLVDGRKGESWAEDGECGGLWVFGGKGKGKERVCDGVSERKKKEEMALVALGSWHVGFNHHHHHHHHNHPPLFLEIIYW